MVITMVAIVSNPLTVYFIGVMFIYLCVIIEFCVSILGFNTQTEERGRKGESVCPLSVYPPSVCVCLCLAVFISRLHAYLLLCVCVYLCLPARGGESRAGNELGFRKNQISGPGSKELPHYFPKIEELLSKLRVRLNFVIAPGTSKAAIIL